jgi:hypothetical protein
MIYVVRGIHSAFALFFMSCLAYIYYAALGRKRSPLLAAAAGALLAEGAVVVINRGDCPLGPVHRRLGDEKTFFELFLPSRLARWAVPFFAAVTAFGFLLAMARPPRRP